MIRPRDTGGGIKGKLTVCSMVLKILVFPLSSLADISFSVFSSNSLEICPGLIVSFKERERLAYALIFTRMGKPSFFSQYFSTFQNNFKPSLNFSNLFSYILWKFLWEGRELHWLHLGLNNVERWGLTWWHIWNSTTIWWTHV